VNKFWEFITIENNKAGAGVAGNSGGGEQAERILRLDGAISQETWWGDEVTPKIFKDELFSGSGDVTVWINSPGGDVFAAAQIYNALKEYANKNGKVTVKIDGLAASAASVIAMAGSEVLMSPVSYMVIHNPATIAIGDSEEMLRTKAMLDEVKEGIINAYEAKCGLDRAEISRLMNEESCFNAKKAVELGFADGILYAEARADISVGADVGEGGSGGNSGRITASANDTTTPVLFSRMAVINSLLNKIPKPPTPCMLTETGTAYNILEERMLGLQH